MRVDLPAAQACLAQLEKRKRRMDPAEQEPATSTVSDIAAAADELPAVSQAWLQPEDVPHLEAYTFRHAPASTGDGAVKGLQRWPGAADPQAHPLQVQLVIWDVAPLLAPFIDAPSACAFGTTCRQAALGPACTSLWLTRPWAPIRRRRWGFGAVSNLRSAEHDEPTIVPMLHHAWHFLSPTDRFACRITMKCWYDYVQLRVDACRKSVAHLRHRRVNAEVPTVLDHASAQSHARALLRFDFYYADFARWMGGEVTNRDRDWQQDFERLKSLSYGPAPPSLPTPDFPRAFRIMSEGVPLAGHFRCKAASLRERDVYDNHPSANANAAAIEAKFAKEEAKSFHMCFPRFLVYFIYGLHLSPLQWEVRKGKGRICVDCTNGPDPDQSAPNSSIPKPSFHNPDTCPPVWYSTALKRFLTQLWELRLRYPHESLLQHADDIDAAFRRILYHPDLAIVFAYVLGDFLLIPIGQVFGSRSCPSYFSLLSDIRQYVASTADLSGFPSPPLVTALDVQVPPAALPASAFPDACHPAPSDDDHRAWPNATFVDDNAVAERPSHITQAVHQSVVSGYLLFGFPGTDRRGQCFAESKWNRIVTHILEFLGYLIDSHAMTITWPLVKRQDLSRDITECFTDLARKGRNYTTPRLVARICGKIQSAGEIAPWGLYMSASTRGGLTRAQQNSFSPAKEFYNWGKVKLGNEVRRDLRLIQSCLDVPEFDPIWTRPIGHMIARTPNVRFKTDASYVGIGGWTHAFGGLMYRVTAADLVAAGFKLPATDATMEPEGPLTDEQMHINYLEFLASIVMIWVVLKCIQQQPSAEGYVIESISDNTSNLSWQRYAARSPNPRFKPLARVCATLILTAVQHNSVFLKEHLSGPLNVEADMLSRVDDNGLVPSWDSVIEACSHLRTCRICLLPSALLSALADLISSPPTEVTYESVTTTLLTHELVILPLGLRPSELESTIYEPGQAMRWSA